MATIEANGTTIAFKRSGAGAPVVLIHGAEADHSMFDAFGAELARHFTVIAYDQRDSGGTRNPAEPYGLDELADDATALIGALGFARAHVFGTSLGGVIAQVLAARYPQRVDRLVLSSTFRAGVSPLSINPEVFSTLATLRAGLPASAGEIARFFFPPQHIERHPEVVAIFNGAARTAEQKQRRAGILARAVRGDLGRITAPTLVLAAAEDRLIPPDHTLALAREIKDARAVTLPGLGHVGTLQDPAAVARAVIAHFKATKAEGGSPWTCSGGAC